MNIGIVCYPTFGGSGVLATELGKALADKGHGIHFITYQQPVRLTGFSANLYFHEVRVPTYPLFDFPPLRNSFGQYRGGCGEKQPRRPTSCSLCNTPCFCRLYGETNLGRGRCSYSLYYHLTWHGYHPGRERQNLCSGGYFFYQ